MAEGVPPFDECRLHERAAEMDAIGRLIDDTYRGSGSLLVIEGEPGIGKSSLIRCLAREATDRGTRTLRARGSELERSYPYGMVLDLLAPLVSARGGARSLSGPAAMAYAIFETDGVEEISDPLAMLHGLYWLVSEAAEESPLLLVIDDAHWADDASLRFAHYMAQRIEDDAVSLVVAFRTGEPDLPDELGLLAGHERAVVLTPAPLSRAAVGRVLADELGTAGTALVDRWHASTRGNPFYLAELLRDHRDHRVPRRSSPSVTAVPLAVDRAIRRRLRTLGEEAGQLAMAVAVLGDGCRIASAAAVAELGTEPATAAAVRLSEAGIFEGGELLAFVHPIVRSAIEASASRIQVARRHRAAAIRLAAEGRPAEAVASHLLRADQAGDPWTVERLEDAAQAAMARGTPPAAVRYLARALEEPPPAYRRAAILVSLGQAESAAGDSAGAVLHFTEAAGLVPGGAERAGILAELGLANMRRASWAAAAAAFQDGLREVGDNGPQAADLHAGFVSASLMSGQPSEEAAGRLAAILAGPIQTSAERHLAASIAFQRSTFVAERREGVVDLARRALHGASMLELLDAGQTVELAAGVLVGADMLDEDIELLSSAMAQAQESGRLGRYCTVSYCRSAANYFSGRLADAVADAEAAVNALALGWRTFYPAASSLLAMALTEMGELDRASKVLTLDPEEWGGTLDYRFVVPLARGCLLLAQGRAHEAARELEAADEVASGQGIRGPAMFSWRAPLVVALAASGRRDRAIEIGRSELDIADAWGAPRARGMARQALGIAIGGKEGIHYLQEAVTILEGSPSELERTRAQVNLGGALRRAGRLDEARKVLVGAMGAAHHMGAVTLRDRARAEISAAGGRPRRPATTGPESLTPAERRVVMLANDGRTNRQIAAALFVTPKAVEYHLANAYRKLNISSRRELSGALLGDDRMAS